MIAEYISNVSAFISTSRPFETNGETSFSLKILARRKMSYIGNYIRDTQKLSLAEVFFLNGKDTRNSRWSADGWEILSRLLVYNRLMNTQARNCPTLDLYNPRDPAAPLRCTKRLILIQIDRTFIYTRNGEKGINPNVCNCTFTSSLSLFPHVSFLSQCLWKNNKNISTMCYEYIIYFFKYSYTSF